MNLQDAKPVTNHILVSSTYVFFVFNSQTVVIDDVSAARVHKLLLIVTLVSNFPLLIVGLGAIMLAIFIILLYRARKQKV